MKEIPRQLTEADRAKQEARRRNPYKIGHDLTVTLTRVGAVQARHDLFLEQMARSIARCKEDEKGGREPTFSIDTITCPLYGQTNPPGDFRSISHVENSLEAAPNYRDKFDRYLLTLSQAARFLGERGMKIKSTVYFGDAGVINVPLLKAQFGVTSDQELRESLTQNANTYKAHLEGMKDQLGLGGVEFHFTNLTTVSPDLQQAPMDLHESIEAKNLLPSVITNISVRDRLEAVGVNLDTAKIAIHAADELAKLRLGKSAGNVEQAVRQSYTEVMGFLLGYGIAAKTLHDTRRPDLFVSLDLPGNYRNDFYYAPFEGRGQGLAVFTPHAIEK